MINLFTHSHFIYDVQFSAFNILSKEISLYNIEYGEGPCGDSKNRND